MVRPSPFRRVPGPLALLWTALLVVSVASPAGAQSTQRVPNAGGDRLWVARYAGAANGDDAANALAVSPDGSRVFVTGSSTGTTTGLDYATGAYDADTGSVLWGARYSGSGNGSDIAIALELSSDGSRVFVTGYSTGASSGWDYATIAYDAATGARLWAARYDAGDADIPHALGVSPDGSTVFVTGYSEGSYATVAYDAATGDRGWGARYHGPGFGFADIPYAVGVSPDGSTVFVTGESTESGGSTYFDYATVAYDAATGTMLWVARYDSHRSDDLAYALGVSPDGSSVYVTGYSYGSGDKDYFTIAYEAHTGARLWGTRYDGGNVDDFAFALGVSPDGSTVFVTGRSGEYGSADYSTLALDASTGKPLWKARYDGPQGDEDVALALGVSPDGSTVFVTGESGLTNSTHDYATLAYDALTGAQLWLDRYNTPEDGEDVARALGVSPDGSVVFVTGPAGPVGNPDYVTIAYDAGP